MAKAQRRRRWKLGLPALVLVVLALPFVIHRSVEFYTDDASVRAPVERVEESIRQVLWEPARALPAEIAHPEYSDFEPRVDPWGETLVFTRGRPEGGADLWLSVKERGRWSSPLPIDTINTDHDELGAAFSADGEWLYFYSDRPGGLGGYDIWASRRAGRTWSEPVALGPEVNSPANEMYPALVAVGGAAASAGEVSGALFFTSDRRAAEEPAPRWRSTLRSRLRAADWDIFVSRADARESSDGEPAARPAFLAAQAVEQLSEEGSAEGAVAVAPATDFLYFASNRAGGEGGFDLYRVRLSALEIFEGTSSSAFSDDTAPPFEIEPLGPQVNTARDELDPALASGGYELYFSRPQNGQEDIFLSFSREVYLTSEDRGPYWSFAALLDWLEDLIRRAPAWLLGVIISLLVCAALLLLFRRWLRSPSVLARCFLIALLLHLLAGVWMNRNKVQRILLEVVSQEETYAPFEVEVEGLAEESVGLAIRQASAETSHDHAPTLSAAQLEIRRVPKAAPRRESSPAIDPLSQAPEKELLPFAETRSRPQVDAAEVANADWSEPEINVPDVAQEEPAPRVDPRALSAPEPERAERARASFVERATTRRAPPRPDVDVEPVDLPSARLEPKASFVDEPPPAIAQREPERVDTSAVDEVSTEVREAPRTEPADAASSIELAKRSVERGQDLVDPAGARSPELESTRGVSRRPTVPRATSGSTDEVELQRSSARASVVEESRRSSLAVDAPASEPSLEGALDDPLAPSDAPRRESASSPTHVVTARTNESRALAQSSPGPPAESERARATIGSRRGRRARRELPTIARSAAQLDEVALARAADAARSTRASPANDRGRTLPSIERPQTQDGGVSGERAIPRVPVEARRSTDSAPEIASRSAPDGTKATATEAVPPERDAPTTPPQRLDRRLVIDERDHDLSRPRRSLLAHDDEVIREDAGTDHAFAADAQREQIVAQHSGARAHLDVALELFCRERQRTRLHVTDDRHERRR